MKDCFGYVYRFIHNSTNKWYIGSHNDSKENYNGSGLVWKYAKLKYGLENFTKEILYKGENCRELEELILMTLDAKNDPMSYNLKNTAIGGAFYGKSNGMFGKTFTDDHRYKCGSAFRGKSRPIHSEYMKGENNPRFGKNDHVFGIVELAKSNKGKTINEIYGPEKADIIRSKMSSAHRGIKKPKISERQIGHLNHASKPISVNGILYGCIKDAMKDLNLSRYKIKQIAHEL